MIRFACLNMLRNTFQVLRPQLPQVAAALAFHPPVVSPQDGWDCRLLHDARSGPENHWGCIWVHESDLV